MRKLVLGIIIALGAGVGADSTSGLDRIVDEGLRHSQVMQTAEYLDDRIGGRLTNSPAMREAETWTQGQFKAWGLRNVRKDGFEFGRGWSVTSSSVKMVAPRALALTAMPVAWSPSTNGVISAPIIVAPMKHERDLQPWHGKLTGKIVLVSLPDDGSEPAEAPFKRLGPDDIAKLDKYENPKIDPSEVEKVFNVDNGSGRIHGIHAEGNVDAAGLLRDWLTPFASMGAGTVVASPTGGTDHVFMQAVGIPAYQFIQDPLDYESRVHHSGIDTFDHLKADDLRQASVVLAGVLFEAANSAKTLPRIPIPTQGTPTNPFKYDDPDTE